MIPYMGPDHPTVTYRVDHWRRVDPDTGVITDSTPGADRGQLRWVVAVVTCPHCGAPHEHPIATTSGWGFYRAGCVALDSSVGYYLTQS